MRRGIPILFCLSLVMSASHANAQESRTQPVNSYVAVDQVLD